MSGGLVRDRDGVTMTEAEGHEAIRKTIERKGRFVLASAVQPEIGEVQTYCGLPMRCVRYVTMQDAVNNHCEDIWGKWTWNPHDFYFEVEVAD